MMVELKPMGLTPSVGCWALVRQTRSRSRQRSFDSCLTQCARILQRKSLARRAVSKIGFSRYYSARPNRLGLSTGGHRKGLDPVYSLVSSLIADAKLTLITYGMDAKTLGEIKAALTFDQLCRSNEYGSKHEGSDPALIDWYSADTLAQLRFLWRLIETLPIRPRKVLSAEFS